MLAATIKKILTLDHLDLTRRPNYTMRELFRVDPSRSSAKDALLFAWDSRGNLLATAEENVVNIWDRHGEHYREMRPGGSTHRIKALDWDRHGETLAVIQESVGVVSLFDVRKRNVTRLETNQKDLSFLKWSNVSELLVVGTSKGNIVVYNQETRKKIPVLGKHPRRITCGAWSKENALALGSDDKTLTLSDENGDTREQTELKDAATEIVFGTQKENLTSHLSVNMGGKSLLLMDLSDPNAPLELAFQKRYGSIVRHEWFGSDGYILLGFSEGFVVVVSTLISEIGEERFSGRFHHRTLFDIAYSPTLNYAAVAGDDGIKLVEMAQFKEIKREETDSPPPMDNFTRVAWSPDGHVLTASTDTGSIVAFLARMPVVHASFGSQIAYLSSLREITVSEDIIFQVDLEPSFLAIGQSHVAVGMNSIVMYYSFFAQDTSSSCCSKKVGEQAYVGTVDDVCLNSRFAAILSGRTVALHEIEPSAEAPTKKFPCRGDSEDSKGSTSAVTSIALTEHFLVFGTDAGTVEFFSLSDWSLLSGTELRHTTPIKSVHPNAPGTRVLCVDDEDQAFVYNPATGEKTPVPGFPAAPKVVVMWDSVDQHVILVADGSELHTFVYAPITIKGAMVSKLGPVEILAEGEVSMVPKSTPVAQGLYPICASEGTITCQVGSTGQLTTIRSPYYEHRDSRAPREVAFCQTLALLRLRDAWEVALTLNGRDYWLALSGRAMEIMDVQLAIRVYRQLGDAGMVMGLERIKDYEDKNLLAGHVLLLFSNYDVAQDLFLSSSHPVAALEMRRDLLHWDQALKLAHTLDPSQEPHISVEYAQQLEFDGDYETALRMFKVGLEAYGDANMSESKTNDEEQPIMKRTCVAGVARCTLRLGDLRRGIGYVKDANDKSLCSDCAAILESMSQHSEAASLYETAEQYERAAAIYVKKLNLTRAANIMDKVSLPKLHSLYAKACESAGKLEDAVKAYTTAHDTDSVVRLYLNELNCPEKAFDIVRKTCSSKGAVLVARFCQEHSDYRGAIEFLLMANHSDEAFGLAKTQGQMETYTSALGDSISPDDAHNVAQYYEALHDLGNAGKFFAICGQYARALKLFVQCGEREINAAIDIVGKARSDALTHTLIDFLMGEPDGVPKDPNYIYRLYIALGNFPQAARTAVVIARQEQELGNYKQAHAILYETNIQLLEQRVHVPQTLRQPFILLHSYLLVRRLIKRADHPSAARMLLRVAKNISKFPSHIVPILTSTVVECFRVGLKTEAFEYAGVLMRPEYRQKIDEKFKRKIEAMVRRPGKQQDADEPDKTIEEPKSPCPISGQMIPRTELECPTTKDEIPMCVVTGWHMEREDWCVCPNSRMPALYSEYVKYIQVEQQANNDAASTPGEILPVLDPVCGNPINIDMLEKSTPEEVDSFLTSCVEGAGKDDSTDEAADNKISQRKVAYS